MRTVRCPKCKQPTTLNPEGNCILCGFCVQKVQRMTLRLYVIMAAVSAATVIYGIIVFAMEQSGPPAGGAPEGIVYGFIGLAAIIGFFTIFGVAPLLRDKPGSAAVFTTLLLQAALAESIAIMGLVLYFVLASIQWFVIFLAVSWFVFTIIGIKLGDNVAEYERRLVAELDPDG